MPARSAVGEEGLRDRGHGGGVVGSEGGWLAGIVRDEAGQQWRERDQGQRTLILAEARGTDGSREMENGDFLMQSRWARTEIYRHVPPLGCWGVGFCTSRLYFFFLT